MLKVPCSVVVKNTPVPPIATTTLSLPYLNRDSALDEKPYEKIRIFQSEIYYRNRPKNWSLPLNQQASMMTTFDADDDINLRLLTNYLRPIFCAATRRPPLPWSDSAKNSGIYSSSSFGSITDQSSLTLVALPDRFNKSFFGCQCSFWSGEFRFACRRTGEKCLQFE